MGEWGDYFLGEHRRPCARCGRPMRFSALLTWLPENGDIRCGNQTHDTDYLYARVAVRVYHDDDGQQLDEPGMLVTNDAMYQQLAKERAAHPMLAGRARTRIGSLGGSNWRVPIWPPPERWATTRGTT